MILRSRDISITDRQWKAFTAVVWFRMTANGQSSKKQAAVTAIKKQTYY